VPRPPVWAAILVGCWLLLVLAGVLLERQGAPELETCLLHRLTGHPCPTCGSTRVVLGLVHGAWLEALRFNPLVTVGLLSGSIWLGIRLVLSRTPGLELSSGERLGLLLAGLSALLLNWAWVLRVQA